MLFDVLPSIIGPDTGIEGLHRIIKDDTCACYQNGGAFTQALRRIFQNLWPCGAFCDVTRISHLRGVLVAVMVMALEISTQYTASRC